MIQLLLVEDDALDRMAVERALAASQMDAELTVAGDAETAIALLAGDGACFDCVLLDHNLPRGSGLTVLQALRQSGDETPVVAMTGYGDEELVVELMKAGAIDYIAKQSLKPERLAQSIRSALLLRDARRTAASAQRALQDQLEFAELLVGIVSHDLRNPLQAIAMSTALLERRGGLPPESQKAVARINNSSQRADRLIRDLLDFTQARSGGIPVAPSRVDLSALLRSLVEETALGHPGREVLFSSAAEAAALQADVDTDRVTQVVFNLLSNALTYGEPGVPVKVLLGVDGDDAVIEVQNHGSAIPPERIGVLFQPMQRLRAHGRRSGSIGLGLYIVDSIVRAHHGSVAVVSADGVTRFVVRLPLAARAG